MSVTTTLQNVTSRLGTMISGSSAEPEILDTLKQEHEEVGELLKQLVDSETGATRKKLVGKIKAALLPHTQAEQTVLYDALIAIRDKKIQRDGEEGYVEHELAAATLAKLEAIPDPMSPKFGAAAKVLKELVEHHVQEEERNVWADAKEKFSADERVALNRKYLAAKKLIGTPDTKAGARPAKKPAVKPAAPRPKTGKAAAAPKRSA